MLGDDPPRWSQTMIAVDWNRVKKQTLWSYEELIRKLRSVLAYDFVLEYS